MDMGKQCKQQRGAAVTLHPGGIQWVVIQASPVTRAPPAARWEAEFTRSSGSERRQRTVHYAIVYDRTKSRNRVADPNRQCGNSEFQNPTIATPGTILCSKAKAGGLEVQQQAV